MAGLKGSVPKVFVSYRRDDSAPYAGRLYDRLAESIGQENIFMDVDSISFGLDFAEAIDTAVESCDVLLAVIGPEWLTASIDDRRRLDDPDDFVRLEIEAALVRKIRVVPVLVDDATLPKREELPPSLTPLVRRQTLRLSHDQFRIETQRLIDDLTRLSADAASTTPPTTEQPDASAAVEAPAAVDVPAAVDAPTVAEPKVTVIVALPKVLKLSVQLARNHDIEVDNTTWHGTITVDGVELVKRTNPEGLHNFTLDDMGSPIPAALSFETTWTASIKNVVLQIGDEVVYRS